MSFSLPYVKRYKMVVHGGFTLKGTGEAIRILRVKHSHVF